MGSRASTLLREEEIEEIKKETGCKFSALQPLSHLRYRRFLTSAARLASELTARVPELKYVIIIF